MLAMGLGVAALLLGSAPPAAYADSPYDYGYTGGDDRNRQPDSRDHWHCKNYFDIHQDWLNSAMSQLDAQTVMYRQDSSSCGSLTDVVWIKTALNAIAGGQLVGRSTCASHVSWGVCEQFWIEIDQPLHYVLAFSLGPSDPGAWYDLNLTQTLRHELGHSAGLHHGPAGDLNPTWGAMIVAWIPNGNPNWLIYLAYQTFQVNLINSHL